MALQSVLFVDFYSSRATLVLRWVFGVGGSNGAISGWTECRYVGENNARGIISLATI